LDELLVKSGLRQVRLPRLIAGLKVAQNPVFRQRVV
jgi:hypothetical protein